MTKSTGHPKVIVSHLNRHAVVYIRQSSAHQIRNNRESSQRQYALVDRAQSLGWAKKSIVTIDEDQGRSGSSSEHRHGFKKLLAEIGAGQVGIVFALEASRLARSSADWHRLVEICVITRTLLADEAAVYDPRDPNDRLLLGVKGTISEAELFTLRSRLHEGRWNKARRGELVRSLPVGYLRTDTGDVVKCPDRQVQSRINYVFRLFKKHKVARRVLLQLNKEKLDIPTVTWGGACHGELRWKKPDLSSLIRMLHNPTYAGAYVYGQYEYDSFDRSPTTGKAKVRMRSIDEWSVCLRDVYPSYITWEEFVEHQQVMRSNWYRSDQKGAPRKGKALLQGLVYCGRCGARMTILHYATKEKRAPGYGCFHKYQREGGATCQCMSATGVDAAVAGEFLAVVSPATIDIALKAMEELNATRDEARRQWELRLQQADYDVDVARRRYEAADPENRLVAGELESLWEQAMQKRQQLVKERDEQERGQSQSLGQQDQRLIKELCNDLPRVWDATTTSMEERKTLLRLLIKRVHLDGVTESGKIRIDIEWHTGARSSLTIDRPLVGVWAPKTPDKALKRIQQLTAKHDYDTIAAMLNAEGFQTAKGLKYNRAVVGYIVRSRNWNRKAEPINKPK